MFVRAKNTATDAEINLNVRHIVSFQPAGDPTQSTVALTNGRSVTLNLSNRALRNAVKKATGSVAASSETEADVG